MTNLLEALNLTDEPQEPANEDDLPERMGDVDDAAEAEALDIIEEHGAGGNADHIEKLADGLLKSLRSYDQGPDFGRLVIKKLRLIARERRQGIG